MDCDLCTDGSRWKNITWWTLLEIKTGLGQRGLDVADIDMPENL